jgi:hypothetical protein
VLMSYDIEDGVYVIAEAIAARLTEGAR